MHGSGVYFVYDELNRDKNREKLCALRKYPALLRLGFEQMTCPKSWQKVDRWSRNQFEFEHPEFIHMDDISESPETDLAAISDQYYEERLPLFSLSQIIDRYTISDARIVVGGDNRNFKTSGAHRPLREMEFTKGDFAYRDVFEAFNDRYQSFGYEFPLDYCLNIFIQENALLYEVVTGDSVDTLTEFFKILPLAPYLPIWETLTEIFTTGVEQGTRLLGKSERSQLGKWLRRRIEMDYHQGVDTARYLNNLARRHERLFDPYYRREMQGMEEAQDYLETSVSDPEDPVAARFRNWLRQAGVETKR